MSEIVIEDPAVDTVEGLREAEGRRRGHEFRRHVYFPEAARGKKIQR